MNRKRLLLLILLTGFVLSLGYAWWAMPRQQRITEERQEFSSAAKANLARGAQPASPHVRFELLGEEPQPFQGAERDIFSFYVKPVAPAPPPPPPPPPPPTAPVAAPPPRPVVQKPLPSFSFLGFLEIDQETIVFVASNEEIYLVRKGETFGRNQEFEVTDIADQVLTVQQSGQASPIRIPLVERETPETSVSSPARLGPLPPVPVEPTDTTQGMSAPARRSPGSEVRSAPARVRFESDNLENLNGLQSPEPSADTGNPEGGMNATNQ